MYEIFAQLLKEHNVTPYQVYKATGVAQSSLSDWKNGKSKPKYEKMRAIADYFGVSVDYLLGNEQKEKPTSTQADELLSALNDPQIMRLVKQLKDAPQEERDRLERIIDAALGNPK